MQCINLLGNGQFGHVNLYSNRNIMCGLTECRKQLIPHLTR